MISSEVQRTLVKSPPELWTELSDPDSLSRHLGELGEIRITRTEPESRVEWEAKDTTGTVLINASGWGTKVTLTVSREVAAPDGEALARRVEPQDEAPVVIDEAPEGLELQTDPEIAPEPPPAPMVEPAGVLDDAVAVEILTPVDPLPGAASPEPRRGFFARLFGRRKPSDASELITQAPSLSSLDVDVEQLPPVEAPEASRPPSPASAIQALQARFQPQQPEIEAQSAIAAGGDEPATGEDPEPRNLAAELKAAEETAVEEMTAILTAVLDNLGAAHHRPFSRA